MYHLVQTPINVAIVNVCKMASQRIFSFKCLVAYFTRVTLRSSIVHSGNMQFQDALTFALVLAHVAR